MSDRSSAPSGAASSRLATIAIPLGLFVLHLATAEGYGIFRDELYYLSCARRPAFGYVDHPPMIAWVTYLLTAVLGDSLLVLRGFAAACLAATVALLALATRELGGGRRAQLMAAGGAALAPILLSLGTILSMNAIDLVIHAGLWWTLARWTRTGRSRLWLLFGLLAGLGLQTKASVAFFGIALAVALVAFGRKALRDRFLWLGGALAVLLGLPHLIWQHLHGYPTLEFASNASSGKNLEIGAVALASEGVLQLGPLAGVLLLLGAAILFRPRMDRSLRLLALVPLLVFVILLGVNAKPYYLAPAFTGWLVLGAVVAGGLGRPRWVDATAIVLALLTLPAAPLAKPILPLESYVSYAAALGKAPSTDERHELGRLPQFFADMVGWRDFAASIAAAAATIPPEQRAGACVFTGNYGEAGAIEHFGRELDLPPPISGHNSWFLWGPQGCTGEVLLVLGRNRERLDSLFEDVTLGGTTGCGDCMPYENELPIWIARRPREGVSIEALWPGLKHYD